MKEAKRNQSQTAPSWYWSQGLHDAKILSATPLELPPDWKSPIPRYNCLEFAIDAKGAMFDQTVRKIALYNYKILTPEFDLCKLSGAWWLSDELHIEADGKYRLQLTIQVFKASRPRNYTVEFRFSEAEVERGK